MEYINDLLKIGSKTIKKMDNLFKISIFMLIISIAGWILSYNTAGTNIYYYNPINNKVISEARYMIVPILNRDIVVNNVNQAIEETFNFDSSNYESILDKATDNWYTDSGSYDLYSQFFNAQNSSGQSLIEQVENNRITVQATVIPGTKIITVTRIGGRLSFQLGVKVLFTYRNRFGQGNNQERIVNVWMVERDTSKYPKGIGIDSIKIL